MALSGCFSLIFIFPCRGPLLHTPPRRKPWTRSSRKRRACWAHHGGRSPATHGGRSCFLPLSHVGQSSLPPPWAPSAPLSRFQVSSRWCPSPSIPNSPITPTSQWLLLYPLL